MTYLYIDLETTANGGPESNSPEAHWNINRVLLAGWAWDSSAVQTGTIQQLCAEIYEYIRPVVVNTPLTIVAHNAKFDIKYILRNFYDTELSNIGVWDTMTWEYRNSGQRETMPSLEDVASTYGIEFSKSLDLGALLSQGIKMEQIPKDELESYLIEDVVVLRKIHRAQEATGNTYDMDYLLPLADMENNGLPLNMDEARELYMELQEKVNQSEGWLRQYIRFNCEWQDGSPVTMDDFSNLIKPKTKCIKPTANRTISMLLTGVPSSLNITAKWKLSLKGQPVFNKNIIDNIYEDITPTHVGYPVDEDTLERLERACSTLIIRELMEHRKAAKIMDTYLSTMMNQATLQGTVHPKLNTAITATGRLSSSQPNGQNMPQVVRELIQCDEDRELEEFDFSQLEMVAAAACSGDKQLIHDIQHGVDIHKNTATQVFGADKADEYRKIAKNVNFGVLYGGKAYGLSKQTGVDKDTVQKLIDAFFNRYPALAKWQRDVFTQVVDNMESHDIKQGEVRYKSEWTLPISGRKFTFVETEAPQWMRRKTGRKWSFSPNQTANYPIQGFAGGDIVMTALTYLWRRIVSEHPEVRLLMTVHDSVLLDKPWALDLWPIYTDMLEHVQRTYNLPVELSIDADTGTNWS